MTGKDIYSIGIDVGGTNTDLVMLRNGKILYRTKTPTSDDVTSGIVKSLNGISKEHLKRVSHVMLGTTHLLNALLQNQCDNVAIIRLALPATSSIPPLSGWPKPLTEAIGDEVHMIRGGYEYDGREVSSVREEKVRTIYERIKNKKIQNVAISGIFSEVNPKQELNVKIILLELDPSLSISMSHEIGGLGLRERENAAILNAGLKNKYHEIVRSIKRALKKSGLPEIAELHFCQNDGTIVSATDVMNPIALLDSSSTNSLRGAARLTNLKDTVIVDIGGTSSDIGVLVKGFPLEENSLFEMNGVECRFNKTRVNSIALGGGTIISLNHGKIIIGPKSVGHKLKKEAIAFGGNYLTLTDIAMLKGRLELQGANLEYLKNNTELMNNLDKIDDAVHRMLAEKIAAAWLSVKKKPNSLVLVGGGAVLFDRKKLNLLLNKRFSKIVIPKEHGCANAVGAAVADVVGKHKKVYDYAKYTRTSVREHVIAIAKNNAIKNGADPKTVVVKKVKEIKMMYLSGDPNEVIVSAIGKLSQNPMQTKYQLLPVPELVLKEQESQQKREVKLVAGKDYQCLNLADSCLMQDKEIASYHAKYANILSEQFMEDMTLGCGYLGSGGGGSTRFPSIILGNVVKRGLKVTLLPFEMLHDKSFVACFGIMGSPTVIEEKMPSVEEYKKAIILLEEQHGRKLDALVIAEIGGSNGLYPLIAAAELRIPVLNADTMGRAFPRICDVTPHIYGKDYFKKHSAVIANCKESRFIQADDFSDLEKKARDNTIEMGGVTFLGYNPMLGDGNTLHIAKSLCIPNSVTKAMEIGRCIRIARASNQDPIEALNKKLNYGVKKIGEGVILDISRSECDGFSFGGVVIKRNSSQTSLTVGFQNENLMAISQDEFGNCDVVEEVPNIITIVDAETFKPISCGELRYGQKVIVLSMDAPEMMNRKEARKVLMPEKEVLKKMFDMVGDKKMKSMPIFHTKNPKSSKDMEEGIRGSSSQVYKSSYIPK